MTETALGGISWGKSTSSLGSKEADDSQRSERGRDRVASIEKHLRSTGRQSKEADGSIMPPAQNLVQRNWFKSTVMIFVVLNALQMGFEVDYPDWKGWMVVEQVFTTVFLLEFLLKVYYLGRKYFLDRWNLLDFGVVCSSVFGSWIAPHVSGGSNMAQLSILRVLRLVRLVKLLKVLRQFRKLVLVTVGILHALESTFWVGLVLIFAIYVSAVVCCSFFVPEAFPGYSLEQEAIEDSEMGRFNPFVAFGSMNKSMLTLFNMAILVEWHEIVRPVMLYQPSMAPFFLLFTMVVCFGVTHVIIGLIVENVIENARKLQEEEYERQIARKLGTLMDIQRIVAEMDKNEDGKVSCQELEVCMNADDSPLMGLLADVESDLHLPAGFTPDELFCMLDVDGDGTLVQEEFVQSFYRLIESGPFQQICLLMTGLNQLRASVQTSHQELKADIRKLGKTVRDAVGIASQMPTPSPVPSGNSARSNATSTASSDEEHQKLKSALRAPPLRQLSGHSHADTCDTLAWHQDNLVQNRLAHVAFKCESLLAAPATPATLGLDLEGANKGAPALSTAEPLLLHAPEWPPRSAQPADDAPGTRPPPPPPLRGAGTRMRSTDSQKSVSGRCGLSL